MIKNKKKALKFAILTIIAILAIYIGTNASASQKMEVTTESIPVLAYHRVVPDDVKDNLYKDDKWVTALSDFEKQMKYLNDERYQTISAKQFEGWHDGQNDFLRKTVMITFDDGDYEIYYNVLPILKKYNLKATAFLVGSDITEKTPEYQKDKRYNVGLDVIEKVRKDYPNLDFQSHTYDLHKKNGIYGVVYGKDLEEIKIDFEKNKKYGFEYLAYPYGDSTPEMIKVAKDSGIKMGFKFRISEKATRLDDKFEIPRIKITGNMTFDDFKDALGGKN